MHSTSVMFHYNQWQQNGYLALNGNNLYLLLHLNIKTIPLITK